MMTHRTKKPFECTFEGCSKSYCDARSLRRHLENHHSVPAESLFDMSLPNYGITNGMSLATPTALLPVPMMHEKQLDLNLMTFRLSRW